MKKLISKSRKKQEIVKEQKFYEKEKNSYIKKVEKMLISTKKTITSREIHKKYSKWILSSRNSKIQQSQVKIKKNSNLKKSKTILTSRESRKNNESQKRK